MSVSKRRIDLVTMCIVAGGGQIVSALAHFALDYFLPRSLLLCSALYILGIVTPLTPRSNRSTFLVFDVLFAHCLDSMMRINVLYTACLGGHAHHTLISTTKAYYYYRLFLDEPASDSALPGDRVFVLWVAMTCYLSTLLLLHRGWVFSYLTRNIWEVDVASFGVITVCMIFGIVFLVPITDAMRYNRLMRQTVTYRREKGTGAPQSGSGRSTWCSKLLEIQCAARQYIANEWTWAGVKTMLRPLILIQRILKLHRLARCCDIAARMLLLRLRRQIRDMVRALAEAVHRYRIRLRDLPEFRHDSLPQGSIRLLRLPQRCIFSGLLSLEVVPIQLQESHRTYEAISYAWGPSEPQHPILLNGRRFTVGPNLYSLLHARSSIFRSRSVWVDALCINQSPGNAEKAEQMPLMKDIYSNAGRVIAWLGDRYDAPLALDVMHDIIRASSDTPLTDQLRSYLKERTELPDWQAFKSLTLENPYFSRAWIFQEIVLGRELQFYIAGQYYHPEKVSNAMRSAFHRGAPSLLRTDGSGGIAIDDFRNMRAFDNWACTSTLREHFKMLVEQADMTLSLTKVLSTTIKLQTTIGVDKIYAVLGIVNMRPHPHAASIVPDYEKPMTTVFEEVAASLLQTPEDLPFIFARAGIGNEGRAGDLPSWVPDWSSESKTDRAVLALFEGEELTLLSNPSAWKPEFRDEASTYRKYGTFKDCYTPYRVWDRSSFWTQLASVKREGKSLLLLGVEVDEISAITAPLLGSDWRGPTGTDIYPWLRAATQIYEDNVPESQRDTKSLWRTLIANRTQCGAIPHEQFEGYFLLMQAVMHMIHTQFRNPLEDMVKPEFETLTEKDKAETMLLLYSHRLFLKVCDDPDILTEWAKGSEEFCLRMQQACLTRRVAVTRGGMLALVPIHTKVGDRVFLIPGLATPFLLRNEEAGSGRTNVTAGEDGQQDAALRYQLVGETYVHGAMEGEKWDDGLIAVVRIVLSAVTIKEAPY